MKEKSALVAAAPDAHLFGVLDQLLKVIAILLEFLMEPILAGMQWLFACYCLINGCVVGMHMSYRRFKKGEFNPQNESITDQYGIR